MLMPCKNYISYVERTDERYHRSHWIIHDGQWIFAEFETQRQLDAFAETIGFSYRLDEERTWFNGGVYRGFTMDKAIHDWDFHFWKLEDLPEDAKPILALSNGHIVTCYFRTTEDAIEFYRPNPNAKEIYKPLSLSEHIAYRALYGSY